MSNKTGFRSLLLKQFVMYYMIHPCIFFLTLLTAIGTSSFVEIGKLIIILAPPVVIIFALPFILMVRKLDRYNPAGEEQGEELAQRLARIPVNGIILIITGGTSGVLLALIIGYRMNIFISIEQSLFFFIIGFLQGALIAAFFYYHSKISIYTYLHKSRINVRFKPLSMFSKLVIPVASSIILLILFATSGIYRISYGQTYEMYTTNISTRLSMNSELAGTMFERTQELLRAYARSGEIRNMNPSIVKSYLRELHNYRGDDIEMFFMAYTSGISPNSLGAEKNISDRPYFKKVMESGKPEFSEPVVNKQTGKLIIVVAVPIIGVNGGIKGVMGATLLLDRIQSILADNKIAESGRYMIISREGKVLLHNDSRLLGKVIGKDIKDDGTKLNHIDRIVSTPVNTFFTYIYNGRDTFSYKAAIPVINHILLFSMDRNEFIKKVRLLMIEMLLGIILLSLAVFVIVRYITRKFSDPIQNTIGVIHRLADGDLTAENNDFLADEFGELIANFKIFQRKLRGIISNALDAAFQLSSSAEELAKTSSMMSVNSQSQAASVEEAAASLEEVSGSVELINNNAVDQADLTRITFASMERLKADNQTVASYAESALVAAKNTTEQANNGQKLMQSTISGMNNINDSTRKIADTVILISDISDQVNLLALNASIEAARAGEHGRGFAVVAEEISKLADQTAVSAKNITEFVNAGLREVESGRKFVNATGAALEKIIDYISQTEELVGKITESAESQAGSSTEVLANTGRVKQMAELVSSSTTEQMLTNQELAKTVEQINSNTQMSAAAAEEIASSAEQISKQSESLREQMQFFRV